MTQEGALKVPQCTYCNDTPFPMAATVSRSLGNGYTMTTTVKASYRLVPGKPLEPMDPPVQFRGDEWPGEDFQGPLRHGTDLVAWKPKCDVLLRASCFPPGGQPASEVLAGFRVGAWSKTVRVLGERTWKVGLFERTPGAAIPFTAMPLDWEHAYGGPEYPDNPAGKGFRTDFLPNVEFPEVRLSAYASKVPPASFLPINRMWKSRMAKMGSADASYIKKRFPLPPGDFDWTYFNEAPADQQLDHYLKGDEELAFANLHAEHPTWSTRLPGMRIRLFIEDRDEEGALRTREVQLNCDTLFANLEEGYLHLLWRGLLPVRSEDRSEITKFYIVQEPLAGSAKALPEHLADMKIARDLGGKLEDRVNAEVAAAKKKGADMLKRYGLSPPPERTTIGPTPGEFASFPFNPNGPLPPQAAKFQSQLDQVGPLREKAMAELRALGGQHGVDVDAIPKAQPADLLALYKKGVQDAIAMMEGAGKPVPDALRQQLSALESPTGDPLGVVKFSNALKTAPIDPASHGNPVIAALVKGDTSAFLAAAQLLPAADPGAKIPGASAAAAGSPGKPAADVPPTTVAPESATDSAAAEPAPMGVAAQPMVPAKPGPRPTGGLDREAARRLLESGESVTGRNLYAADFSGLDLSGRDFTQAQLMHVCFRGANLTGCTFASTLLRQADLVGANLRGARLGLGDYHGADFSHACLAGAVFDHLAFVSCHFAGADLSGSTFASVMLDGVDLTGVDLCGAVIDKCVWQKCLLRSAKAVGSSWAQVLVTACSLDDADFTRAAIHDTVLMASSAQRLSLISGQLKGMRAFNGTDLQGARMTAAMMADTSWMYVRLDEADFSNGILHGANFMFSSAIKARFANADLKGGMLRHARLQSADFHGANLCKASFGHADLTDGDLRGSNCYQTDFQDATITNIHLDGANLKRSNIRRG